MGSLMWSSKAQLTASAGWWQQPQLASANLPKGSGQTVAQRLKPRTSWHLPHTVPGAHGCSTAGGQRNVGMHTRQVYKRGSTALPTRNAYNLYNDEMHITYIMISCI